MVVVDSSILLFAFYVLFLFWSHSCLAVRFAESPMFLARHENVSYCISQFFFVVVFVFFRTITRDAVLLKHCYAVLRFLSYAVLRFHNYACLQAYILTTTGRIQLKFSKDVLLDLGNKMHKKYFFEKYFFLTIFFRFDFLVNYRSDLVHTWKNHSIGGVYVRYR